MPCCAKHYKRLAAFPEHSTFSRAEFKFLEANFENLIWLAKNFSKCNDFCLLKLFDSHLSNQTGDEGK